MARAVGDPNLLHIEGLVKLKHHDNHIAPRMNNPTASSQNLKIRKAIMSDAKAICEIYNQAVEERIATFETEPRTETDQRKRIAEQDERHPILVAEFRREDEMIPGKYDQTILGWASISTYRPRSCYSAIGEFSIYVEKGSRGRGVGKRLMTALIQEAKQHGYAKLVSRIFPFNVASRNLCRSCGFREVGTYEKHGRLDGKWVDTVIVERLIHENVI
jgi:L-amino acid N-acyltransferase YncA